MRQGSVASRLASYRVPLWRLWLRSRRSALPKLPSTSFLPIHIHGTDDDDCRGRVAESNQVRPFLGQDARMYLAISSELR